MRKKPQKTKKKAKKTLPKPTKKLERHHENVILGKNYYFCGSEEAEREKKETEGEKEELGTG